MTQRQHVRGGANELMGDGGDENYADYEVIEVEEVQVDSGRCLCWKGGHEYRHVAWLRFTGRTCTFQIYRGGGATLVAVEQLDVCEECIERVRDLTRTRKRQLVERRPNLNSERRSCVGGNDARVEALRSREPPQRS